MTSHAKEPTRKYCFLSWFFNCRCHLFVLICLKLLYIPWIYVCTKIIIVLASLCIPIIPNSETNYRGKSYLLWTLKQLSWSGEQFTNESNQSRLWEVQGPSKWWVNSKWWLVFMSANTNSKTTYNEATLSAIA